MGPTADDLEAAADACARMLAIVVDADWAVPVVGTEWTCRQTLIHVAGLTYAPQLATRAADSCPLAAEVTPGAPVDQLIATMRSMAFVLGEVARAAPPSARAFHPAGMADPSGWIAMGMDELLVHTHDLAATLGVQSPLDDRFARVVLDRLFPWWPSNAEPVQALLWANGRASLPGHANPGEGWLWHCAPLSEWDGTVPQWDAGAGRPRRG